MSMSFWNNLRSPADVFTFLEEDISIFLSCKQLWANEYIVSSLNEHPVNLIDYKAGQPIFVYFKFALNIIYCTF